MSYRDEHDAALARIAALEEELRGRGGEHTLGDTARRLDEVETAFTGTKSEMKRLGQRVLALRGEAVALRNEMANHERALSRVSPSSTELPTLVEFNRQRLPIAHGRPAGVRCPLCANAGDSVEMVEDSPYKRMLSVNESVASLDADGVMCPRCFFFGAKRQ